MYKIVSLT